jgi:hypothetical protein
MGSINSASPANSWVSNLAQSLGASTPVLASSPVQSAIENASPEDLVQLSSAAQNLQETGVLFGPAASPTVADPGSLLLQAVTSSITGTTATTTAASTDPTTLLFQAINNSFSPTGTVIPGTV